MITFARHERQTSCPTKLEKAYLAAGALADALGDHLEKTPLDNLGTGMATFRRSLFDPFGGFGNFSICWFS